MKSASGKSPDILGFSWDSAIIPAQIPVYSPRRACACFQRMLAEFVWDAGVLEGNPFTFPEVHTLLDGVTVGGHKLADQEQILNLAASCRHLLALTQNGQFRLDKEIFCALHGLVANGEALEWGHFRGEGEECRYTPEVALGEMGRHRPPPTEAGALELTRLFHGGVTALSTQPPFVRALAFFLFGALWQFFFDGNKRTSRLMMNGILMSHGIDAISVPAAKKLEFNEKMVRFYVSRDATEMMRFLVGCHPELGER